MNYKLCNKLLDKNAKHHINSELYSKGDDLEQELYEILKNLQLVFNYCEWHNIRFSTDFKYKDKKWLIDVDVDITYHYKSKIYNLSSLYELYINSDSFTLKIRELV